MTKIAIDDGRPVGYYTTEQVCEITGVKPVTLRQYQVDRILAHIKSKECLL